MLKIVIAMTILVIAVSGALAMRCHRRMLILTGRQIRAARGLLGWTQQQLADKAIVSVGALKQLESGSGDPKSSTITAVRTALEAAGIEFLAASGGRGEGVRAALAD